MTLTHLRTLSRISDAHSTARSISLESTADRLRILKADLRKFKKMDPETQATHAHILAKKLNDTSSTLEFEARLAVESGEAQNHDAGISSVGSFMHLSGWAGILCFAVKIINSITPSIIFDPDRVALAMGFFASTGVVISMAIHSAIQDMKFEISVERIRQNIEACQETVGQYLKPLKPPKSDTTSS